MEFFEHVEGAPLDPIFGLSINFAADRRKNKVNLGAGVYKTVDLKPFILKTVKKAETLFLEKEQSKDYLPIDGLPAYIQLTKTLVFGPEERPIYGVQTVGGTGALSIGGHFLKAIGLQHLYLSNPTWVNHQRIFRDAGFEVHDYPYFSAEKGGFDFAALMEAMNHMAEGSVVLLQVCCHNPTGFDPSLSQWKEICEKMKNRGLFPFFDLAYQGFGDDPEKDVAPLQLFLQNEVDCAVAVSHAKNFGIYAERCGALFFVCRNEEIAQKIGSRIKVIIRGLYSNPPCHGAQIVAAILQNEELKAHWKGEVALMRERIIQMRQALARELQVKTASSAFDFMMRQKGMFSYTGLNEHQVAHLIQDYGIYLPQDGRINIAGLNFENLEYVTSAILACQ